MKIREKDEEKNQERIEREKERRVRGKIVGLKKVRYGSQSIKMYQERETYMKEKDSSNEGKSLTVADFIVQ